MAEIEPASDELVAQMVELGKTMKWAMVMPKPDFLAILARLRKAETDNANMAKLLQGYHQICSDAGIAPASSEIYAAAGRAGGENG